jgi:multiple sugar transport system permease protein
MAISAVSDTTLREALPLRRHRLLEDERSLGFVLLMPTIVLLGMFIAYPFIRGILLSVTSSRVGMPWVSLVLGIIF